MARVFLALLLGVVVTGCASLGVRTEGESGPLTWHLTDLQFTGEPGEGTVYSFTLVMREKDGHTLRFTKRSDVHYSPEGAYSTSAGQTERAITWEFQPYQIRRKRLRYRVSCQMTPCLEWGIGFGWHVTLTGTDEEDTAVKAVIQMQLPHNPDTYRAHSGSDRKLSKF